MLLSLVAFVFAAPNPSDLGRDLTGKPIEAGAHALVFWSTGCAACLAPVAPLQAVGIDVVLVNTDDAGARSTLLPYVRSQGLDAQVVADPTGALQSRFRLDAGVVLLDSDGAEVLRDIGSVNVAAVIQAAGVSRIAMGSPLPS
jgi:hypothetical protein